MKNCLIVLVVLIGCFLAAVFLLFFSISSQPSRQIAEWRTYSQPMYMIAVFPDIIYVDEIDATTKPRRFTEKGTWRAHAFYCDSHLDAPAEIAVASEKRDEDLEIDIGHFTGGGTRMLTAVKMMRGVREYHPFPTYNRLQTVTYPPPRGLIRPGMLQCDLDTLPWRAQRIDVDPDAVQNALNGTDQDSAQNIVNGQTNKELYTFRSDRPDASKLLVTVEQGRVTRVEGGAEDTADVPYQLPNPPAGQSGDQPDSAPGENWATRVFFWLLGK